MLMDMYLYDDDPFQVKSINVLNLECILNYIM